MTEQSAAPLRRGSIVWRGRATWLVYEVADRRVRAYRISSRSRTLRSSDLAIVAPAEQLLTRISGLPVVRLAAAQRLKADGLEYAGELSGQTMCRVTQALVRLAADAAAEERWNADRRHRARAAENRCAV